MRKLLRSFLLSLLYWLAALTAVGLVLVIHGDCFADAACTAEKSRIGWIGLAITSAGYALLVFMARSRTKAGQPE